MATFSKKVYMKNSAGTQQTALIYSTTGETGSSNYLSLTVDGQNGYTPLVATTSSKATSGRVTKGSTTYAIGSMNPIPAYATSGILTTSGTFTVPTDVYKLRVTCVGGGAGGYLNRGGANTSSYAVSGGDTTFKSVTAKGATGSDCYIDWEFTLGGHVDAPDYYACTVIRASLGKGYTPAKHYGDKSYHTGPSTPISNVNDTQVGTAGKGGDVDVTYVIEYQGVGYTYNTGSTVDWQSHRGINATGASGFRSVGYVNVSPGEKIAYTVGQGGVYIMYSGTGDNIRSGTGSFTGGSEKVSSGGSGAVFVEWGQGI